MYNVQFVGLVCFFNERAGVRRALLPDGRDPHSGIDKHFPRIVVTSSDVLGGEGWENDVTSYQGDFPLPACSIECEGTVQENLGLDTSGHDGILPSLAVSSPGFRIEPSFSGAVVQVLIKSGELRALRLPGTDDTLPHVALVSQLTVPHDGEITIRIRSHENEGFGGERTLLLKANSEVVVANVSDGRSRFNPATPSHFKIYEKLSDSGAALTPPSNFVTTGVPRLSSTNPIFSELQPIGLAPDCSNTGCC